MTEPAFSVRGSSRRMMSMRISKPANTRLINRRDDPLDYHLCCWPIEGQQHNKTSPRRRLLTKVPILELQLQTELQGARRAHRIKSIARADCVSAFYLAKG